MRVRARWGRLFRALPWLAAALVLSACGPTMERGPSRTAARPGVAEAPPPAAAARPEAPEAPADRRPPHQAVRARPSAPAAPPPALAPAPDLGLPVRPGAPPQRVASVRMTEHARRLLRSGQHARALTELEKSLSTDGSNPYTHYYMAVAHHRLGNFTDSLDFLDAAEPVLGHSPPWLVRSLVLRGDNLRALGRFDPAGAAYRKALSVDPASRQANQGLLRAQQQSKVQSW